MEEIKANEELKVDDERFIENNKEIKCMGKGPDEPVILTPVEKDSDINGNE
jgi:hypothetical protein